MTTAIVIIVTSHSDHKDNYCDNNDNHRADNDYDPSNDDNHSDDSAIPILKKMMIMPRMVMRGTIL